MKALLAGLAIWLLGATLAQAGFSSATLSSLSVDAKPNAQLPLQLKFVDENGTPRTLQQALAGQPGVLVFADYTCRTLCGPILSFAASGLEKSGLRPGADFHLVVVGIDPKDGLDKAREMRRTHIGADSPVAAASIFLTGDKAAIQTITKAAGYHYAYDPQHDQFAHPAAAYVLTGAGRIARVLSGIGLDGGDLRLALVDAGQGRIGTIVDRIHLLCYGFDPARGIYTASISRWLNISGVATVILIAGGLSVLTLRARRRRST